MGCSLSPTPRVALIWMTPERYEMELMRWAGLAVICLAAVRPWALAEGGDAATRMRRWTGVAFGAGLLYVVTTNALFLVVGFATVAAAVLDTAVERASRAANEVLARLAEEGGLP